MIEDPSLIYFAVVFREKKIDFLWLLSLLMPPKTAIQRRPDYVNDIDDSFSSKELQKFYIELWVESL